jgi:hypothetical protein
MDQMAPIHADRDEAIDEYIGVLSTEREFWSIRSETTARAPLRIMADSDSMYTVADLWNAFHDPVCFTAFLQDAIENGSGEPRDRKCVSRAIEENALFTRATEKRKQLSQQTASNPPQ